MRIRWVVIYISNSSLTPRCVIYILTCHDLYSIWFRLVGAQIHSTSHLDIRKLHEAYFALVDPLCYLDAVRMFIV